MVFTLARLLKPSNMPTKVGGVIQHILYAYTIMGRFDIMSWFLMRGD